QNFVEQQGIREVRPSVVKRDQIVGGEMATVNSQQIHQEIDRFIHRTKVVFYEPPDEEASSHDEVGVRGKGDFAENHTKDRQQGRALCPGSPQIAVEQADWADPTCR